MDSKSLPTPGVSGKKFTIALIGTMIIVGGLLAYELTIYENLDRARAKSAEHWRAVAVQLDNDYRQIEASSSQNQTLDAAWVADFRHAADQFRTATNMEEQLRVGRELESKLQSNPAIQANLPKMSEQLRQEIQSLNASLSTENAIQRSLAGRVVQFFIRHSVRQQWEVIR